MAKISDTSGSSNIWLGSKQNTRQTILYVPASNVAGSDSTDKPGLLFLEAVDNAGTITDGLYVWADSGSGLRYSATYPTDEDSSGTLVGTAAGANTALSNLASVAINTALLDDIKNTDDIGSATKYWKDLYIGGDIYIQEAVASAFDYRITFETPSADRLLSVPYVAADADIMLDAGATANAISYTKGTASITLAEGNTDIIIGAAGQLQIGTGTVAFNGAANMDVASGKAIDINMNLTVNTANVTLDQDLQAADSPTFVGLTLTGAIATPTNITMSGALSGGTTISLSSYLRMADDQQIQLGDSGSTDSYIQYDESGGDLEFYDGNVGGPYTLTELLSGTPLNPVVVGDLTIGDGQFDWTNATAGDVATWTFASTGTTCIDIIADQQSTGDIININADLIDSGNFIHLDTNETNGAFKFLDLHDGGGATFTVALHGATVIGGNAIGTAALTLTAGDFIVTDGRLRVDIATDGAANGHIFNSDDNGTSNIPLLQLITTDSSNDQPLLQLDSAATGDINLLEFVNDGTGYCISMDLSNNIAAEGLEVIFDTGSTHNGILLDGGTGTYVGADTYGMLKIHQTGTLAHANASALFIDFDGAPAASGMGYALLLDDNASAVATSYAMSINSNANVPLHLKAVGATKSALVVETNAQTVSSVVIDGATNNWQGAANVAMVHLSCDDALANAAASLLGCYQATANPINSARGFLARFIDTSPVADTPPAYAVEINSTNNFGLNIVTDIISATNLTMSGKAAQTAAILNVVGSTGAGWDGATGVGMVNLAGLGAHAHENASLLNITDGTGAMKGADRGSCLRIVDTTSNGADSWIAYMSTTSNDGLLITSGHAADIDLKLSSSAAGTAEMFNVDGTTGHWVGANDVGMVDVHTDGVLIAGANLLRIDSSGANNTNSHAVEIITSGAYVGSTAGTSLRITDTGATAGTSYAVYIASTSNEAIHVDTGTVVVDEYVTAGVASSTAGGLVSAYYSADLTDTPVDGEFDTAFGSTALAQPGFIGVAKDTSLTKTYLVVSDGTNWYYTAAMEQAGA